MLFIIWQGRAQKGVDQASYLIEISGLQTQKKSKIDWKLFGNTDKEEKDGLSPKNGETNLKKRNSSRNSSNENEEKLLKEIEALKEINAKLFSMAYNQS
jgi:NAD+--asparagine ADP-ribosyltransferase